MAVVIYLSVLLSRVEISSATLEFESATSSCETLLEEAINRIAQLESKNDALMQTCECIGGSMSSATTTISDLDEDLNISKHLYQELPAQLNSDNAMATSGGSSLGYAPALGESPWSPLERTTYRYEYYNGLRDELLEFDGPDFYRTQSQARLTSSDEELTDFEQLTRSVTKDDTIVVISANITFNSTIVISGVTGLELKRNASCGLVMLDGKGSIQLFYITQSDVVFRGIHFTNGYATLGWNGYDTSGGAMFITSSSNVSIVGCSFLSNSADDGGGVYSIASTVSMDGCSVTSNSAEVRSFPTYI